MPAGEVEAHQRARFHSAMVELGAERGYAKVAVQDLAAVAKVSTRAFYKLFSGKEDCFLRTVELVVRRTAKRVMAAQAGERDWHDRLRLGFRAFVRELEREPEAARLVLVEAHLDGPAARARARKAELLFGAMLAESFERAPDGLKVPSLAVEAIVAGVAEVARAHLLSKESPTSAQLADELMEWALERRERAAAARRAAVRLSPGRAAASETRPGTSDRDVSLAAAAKLAATEGYARLTIPRIRAAAGISRQRFDAEFDGVDDCLTAAREERLEAVLARADGARSASKGRGAGAAVLALCRGFADDPLLARLCFAPECAEPELALRETKRGARLVERVAQVLYGEKATEQPSVMAQAGAGMAWTMMGIRALSESDDTLPRASAFLAELV
jgi:AcrR family transcriptional regulator